jgi:hypothetical protein
VHGGNLVTRYSRYLRSLIVVGLALTCVPQAFAGDRALPDQVISTPIGNIRIANLKVAHVLGFQFIDGQLINETNKTWDNLWLALEMSDKNGRVVVKTPPSAIIVSADPEASSGLHARNLTPGAKFKIKYQEQAKADNDTLAITFKYAAGSYPLSYKVSMVKPLPSDTASFQDDAASFNFALEKTSLSFVLKNKGDAPIKIDWNLVSFVQPDGNAQSVVHNGVKLIDRTAPKAPTMVPPRARIEDSITPVDNIELVENVWTTNQLLPAGPTGLKLVGEEFSIFLPLDIGGSTKNYNFVFKILSVE